MIAKRNGLDFSAVKDATRQDNELSPTLTALLFLKNQGDVFSVQTPDGYAVGKITRITSANPDDDVVGVFEMNQRLGKIMGAENAQTVLSDFAAYYQTRVNTDVLSEIEDHLKQSAGKDDDDY